MSESELSKRIDEMEKRILFLELEVRKLSKQFRELRQAMRAFACEEKEPGMTDEQETARTNKHIGSSFGDFDAEQAAISQVCKWLLEQSYATGHGDNLDDVLTHLVEQVGETPRPKRCRWVEFDMCIWKTECGYKFESILDATPQENSMKYCPYCGGEIVTYETKGE